MLEYSGMSCKLLVFQTVKWYSNIQVTLARESDVINMNDASINKTKLHFIIEKQNQCVIQHCQKLHIIFRI